MTARPIPLFGLERPAPTKDDYFTPAWVFDGLGLEFDIDVAAPPGGVPWIPARRYFTQADDGLAQEWEGLVWCNPPFSGARHWARRFTDHGNGVLLASIPNDTTWFPEMLRRGALVWFHDIGIDFHNAREGGRQSPIPWPTMMAAMGSTARSGLVRLSKMYAGALVELADG